MASLRRRRARALGSDARELLSRVPRAKLAVIVALGAIAGVAEAALLVLIAQVAAVAIDDGSFAVGTSSVAGMIGGLPISTAVGVGLGAAAASLASHVISVRLMATAAADQLQRDRESIFAAYLRATPAVQQKTPAGHLQEVLSQHTTRAAEGLLMAAQVAGTWANLGALLVAAVVVSPVTALAVLAIGALLGAAFSPITRAVGRHSREWASRGNVYASHLASFARMTTEVRSLGVTSEVESHTASLAAQVTQAWRKNRLLQRGTPGVFRSVVLAAGLGALGAVAILAPSAVGALAVVALLMVRALSYLQAIQQQSQMLREMASFSRSAGTLRANLEPDSVEWGTADASDAAELTLAAVDFDFGGDRVLTAATLRVRRGESVAIVGKSGAGKSTALRIAARLVAPSAGRVLLDGREAREFSEASWRKAVAFVPQETRLVPGTLRDNVTLYRAADDAATSRALERAALPVDHDLFPAGLDSPIDGDGANLSGGQRQRIGLARGLLAEPRVLLLDEPTSALDAASERAILATIAELADKVAVVMVTHREAATSAATRVYEVDRGVLSERKGSGA